MKFSVTVKKKDGPDEKRIIDAPTRFAVYKQVEDEGGTVLSITEHSFSKKLPKWLFISFGTGIKRAEIVLLTKNLAAMLNAGLSLARSLSVIERQSKNKNLKKVVTNVAESVNKGSSFHAALKAYPAVFSELFTAMARAGEESGTLAESLSVVGVQMERAEQLTRKIRGAMIYPSIVITAVIIVGILMLVFVVPTLTKTFTQLHVKLPLATQIIVAISNFMVANVLLVFIGLVALVIGGIMFVRSKRGSAVVLAVALHIPVIGELVRETYTARASRTLSSLLLASVPVVEALSITKEVVHAKVFADVIDEAATRVKKGEPLSIAFTEHSKLYPILMGDMLTVGEETGKVADMLKQIAEFYEEDVSNRTKDLSTIIEPLLMLVIGAGVGVFAVSIISPIYSLSSAF